MGFDNFVLKGKNEDQIRNYFIETMRLYGVGGMVVGLPLLPHNGKVGPRAVDVLKFVKSLDLPNIPKVLMDERYTTALAEFDDYLKNDKSPVRLRESRSTRLTMDKESARIILTMYIRDYGPLKSRSLFGEGFELKE